MVAGISKLVTALKLLKDKNSRNLGKKIVIIILSPWIGLFLLIGGIFSDGIDTNHTITHDLYYGNPLDTSDMDEEQKQFLADVEDGLLLLNTQIDKTNSELVEGKLDSFKVKGYYMGIMFSEQKITLDEEKAKLWVESFTKEEAKEEEVQAETGETTETTETTENPEANQEEQSKRYPTTLNTDIYPNIEKNFSITLQEDTKTTMEKIYSGLIGGGSGSGTGSIVTLSKEEIQAVIDNLPQGTSELRKNVVIQAADAVGKIPYYWGGTASMSGYDGNNFGTPVSPDADGRSLKGLDCSHFVDWVYWGVVGDNLGNMNTTGIIAQCEKINESELLPGDLAFLLNANGQTTHVGIYAGKRDGKHVWIHENAGANNVSMDTVSYWSGYYRLTIMEGK